MAALSRRFEVVGLDRNPWWGDEPLEVVAGDLGDPAFVQRVVAHVDPQVTIHCAALANVDTCEQDPALAYASNVGLTEHVVRALPTGCLMIYLSTDGVFKGENPFATEDDLPCPRTVYGQSKVQGERVVAQATDHHLIVRTNFYGWSSGRKKTAGEWLYHSLVTQRPITLFTDFFFTPIYVVDLVERVMGLLDGSYRGTIHLAGRDRLSKYDFGSLLAKAGQLSMANVRAGSMDSTPLLAPRPKDMSLSSQRFVQLTGLEVPDGLSGVQRFLADRGRPMSQRFAMLEARDATSA